ncbi:MAG: adenylate/guanylate cyclase domain-containing protein [Syntrophaceae bacterium]|nr:adenylate/guanylate cyclase domain-containing protein [Syntrophaceae bacterium]
MKFRPNRTFICSVVFIDIVAYSMKPVDDQMRLKEQFTAILANSIRDVAVSDRIVLDTGDGAAVSFLSDPEEALIAAMGIQGTIRSLPRDASPLLEVRIGINLGPVKLIKDINDNPNLVGDGINVAQRIMSFAGPGELLVSRSYFDVVSRLSEDYSRLFQYRGARADKHVREHDIYQVTPPAAKPAPAPEPVIIGQPPPPQPIAIEPEKENKQDAGEEKEIEREKQTTEAEPAKPAARPQAGPGLLRNRKRMFGIGGALLAVIVIVVLLIVPGVRKASQTGKTADAPKTSKEQPAQPASALLSGKKRAEAEEERLEFRAQSLKADEIVFTLSGARLSGKQVTLVVHARNQSRAAKSIALYDSAYRWTKSSITDQAGRSSVVSSVYSMSGGKKTTMYQAGTAGLPVAAGSSTSIYMTFPAPSRSVRSLRSFHLHPFIYQGRNWREHSLTFRSVGIES